MNSPRKATEELLPFMQKNYKFYGLTVNKISIMVLVQKYPPREISKIYVQFLSSFLD